ncbi:hypothetical protein [Lentilactobacillus fungorum]|uniref:hypothetical protein n=1 Tax=Lentilactobacillus fungorum TaxID=2201250 RepID=UPI0019424690|nr:hypothetical protein [Lentilactobacillus fungorum]
MLMNIAGIILLVDPLKNLVNGRISIGELVWVFVDVCILTIIDREAGRAWKRR